MQIISVFLFCTHQWSLSFPLNNEKRTLFTYYRHTFTLDLGYTKAAPSLLFILEGGIFRLIFCVIFTIFNINSPFFISWKTYVVFVHLACHRWSTNLLDVELMRENELERCQRYNLLFVVPGWLMPYFHLPPFVLTNNMEKVKWVKLLSLFTSLHLISHLLFLLWKSVEHYQPLLH